MVRTVACLWCVVEPVRRRQQWNESCFRLQSNIPDPIHGAGEALRCLRMCQGRVELVERPIYLVAGDHQRRTDTNGVVVGVLT